MHVLKFGGTSLGNAECITNVFNILLGRSQKTRVGVVVSAIGGITDYLANSIQDAIKGINVLELIMPFRIKHEGIINALFEQKKFLLDSLQRYLDATCSEYDSLLRGAQLIKECPDSVY
ncbi:MAG: bifunctional aspartate kinase/homoserine dehydrogenase I, partial [Gammaproteobacteria bacterium]